MEPFVYGGSTENNGPLIRNQCIVVSDFRDNDPLMVSLFGYNEVVRDDGHVVYVFKVKSLKSKEKYVGERSYSPPAY